MLRLLRIEIDLPSKSRKSKKEIFCTGHFARLRIITPENCNFFEFEKVRRRIFSLFHLATSANKIIVTLD